MKSSRVIVFLAALAFSAIGFTSTGRAASSLVLIDFSNAAAAPANQIDTLTGNYWNVSTAGASLNVVSFVLAASDLSATSLRLSYTTSGSDGGAATGSTASTLFSSWVSSDFLYASSDTITMTVAGLTANQSYNFILYASRSATEATTGQKTGLYTLTSGASTSNGTLNAAMNVNTTLTLTVVADATGVATLAMAPSITGGIAYLNALEISAVAVPEPGTTALLFFGGISLCLFWRKAQYSC